VVGLWFSLCRIARFTSFIALLTSLFRNRSKIDQNLDVNALGVPTETITMGTEWGQEQPMLDEGESESAYRALTFNVRRKFANLIAAQKSKNFSYVVF
jgi:hypothetical protein